MKRYLYFDSEKCSACGACALACMDQNDIDIPAGEQPFRHTFTLEGKTGDLHFYSVSCMHCADAPCVMGCPCGCLTKDPESGFIPPTVLAAIPVQWHALTGFRPLALTGKCANATHASSARRQEWRRPVSRSAPPAP